MPPLTYTSTRLSPGEEPVEYTFADAISKGYAPNGGLFVPRSLPSFSVQELEEMSKDTYPEVAFSVIRRFIDESEICDEDLLEIMNSTYSQFIDPANAVTVVQPPNVPSNVYISELFNGPTNCFKDLGLQGLINLLVYFCKKFDRRRTLVVATTGDTGPAAIKAVADADCELLNIVVNYPEGQISDFQRKQMTTIDSRRCKVSCFQGGGDDMDGPIKNIGMDTEFANSNGVCGVNSYNFGRPLMQTVHYFWTYFRVAEMRGITDFRNFTLDIVLPTGAMGNIVAGYISKKCGLPLNMMNAAVNVNDITHRAFQSGEFHRADEMKMTLSDAINIQVPYNFERLLYYLTGERADLMSSWYKVMETTQKMDVPSEWMEKMRAEFNSARITDERMITSMKKIYEDSGGYVCCPHSSVAMAGAEELGYFGENAVPVAVLATASPVKFQKNCTLALGKDGWETYARSAAYPLSAKAVESKEEVEGVLMTKGNGEELKVAQKQWEVGLRKIIENFGAV